MELLLIVVTSAAAAFQTVISLRQGGIGLFAILSVALLCIFPCITQAGYEKDIVALAEQGDGQAQYALALLYEYGSEKISRDKKKSLQLLQQAARKQVAGACLSVGLRYEYGNGVERNFKKARCYYLCAAKQDWPMAQFFLADFYAEGKGGERSLLTALTWLGLAQKHGYPQADTYFLKLQRQSGVNDFALLEGLQEKLMGEPQQSCD